MARRRRRQKNLPTEPVRVKIESMSHDGRGVAHINDKAVFIAGALPDEEVEFVYEEQHRKYDEGQVVKVISASPDRVEPECPWFGTCGGCSLQHLSPEKQIYHKQQVLLDNLTRIGHVQAETILDPLTADHWRYRKKARLGVRYVHKKERVLVGFRERKKRYITDIHSCKVLHPSVGENIDALAELIASLSIYEKIPQIEVAISDEVTALVFRVLEDPSAEDMNKLKDFGKEHGFHIYLQTGGPDTVALLYPDESVLRYRLDHYDVELQFLPIDFTQINSSINQKMIDRALELLDIQTDDRVLDLFCGIGNFTLAIARRAGHVVGVEGEAGLIQRAEANAERNGIRNAEFYVNDLTDDLAGAKWTGQHYDKILLDPPRSGAFEVLPLLTDLGAERIVYVSCHPGSLARDAGELVNRFGYKLVCAGVMDMFPHTSHVESIALFEKKRK